MDRVFSIIKIILRSKEVITIDSIANSLNISNKTIRNELKKVEEYVEQQGLRLIKKPGSGITIQGEESKKLDIIKSIEANEIVIEPFSPEDRKNYILKRLFMSEEAVTIKELAVELYVSRVTIHKDLEVVESWLKEYDLKLFKKTNYGLEIVGSEDNWRKAVASLITVGKENEELKELLYKDYTGRIDYKTLVKLRELINIDYKLLECAVVNAEAKLKFKIPDEAFISLVIHIAISIKRLQQSKDIHLSTDMLVNLKGKQEYAIAEDLASEIGEAFKVKLPESEIGYITLHLLGAKMQKNKVEDVLLEVFNDEDELSHIMAREIIEKIEKVLTIDLSEDKQLFNGLILHLRPTINRLKYGMALRNPILEQIKSNYPETYGAAWISSSVFQKYVGKKISEEEIGYIALHFAAAVERQSKCLNALVVCTSGIGTSQLLAVKLRKHFVEIKIKDVVSYVSIKEENLIDVDIIISTVPITINKPVINISPLLTQNDIRRLDQFVNSLNSSKNYKLERVIDEDYIFINSVFKNKQELLETVCSKLYKDGYVKEDYLRSILERERMFSTEVGSGVAVPHGSPQYVNSSRISIIMLNNPMKWKEEFVDIVLLICIAENDVQKFGAVFRYMYNKIEDSEFLNKFRNCKDKQKLKKLFIGNNLENNPL